MVGREPGHFAEGKSGRTIRIRRELLSRHALAAWTGPCADADDVAPGGQSTARARKFLFLRQRKARALSGVRLRLTFRRVEGHARAEEPRLSAAPKRRSFGRSRDGLHGDCEGG